MASLALIASAIAADGPRHLARADCAAVQLARQANENAVAVCPMGDRVAIEYALAAGIREVYELDTSPPAEFETAFVGTGGAELVGDLHLARWAEISKATLLFDVLHVSEPVGKIYEVECDAGRGARHVLGVRGPLIMVLSPDIARPAYVSRYRRHAGAQQLSAKPSSTSDRVATGLHAHDWNPVRPRVRTRRGPNEPSAADDRLNDAFSIRAGGQEESTNVIVADPETCARHILRYLAHHSLVSAVTMAKRLEMPTARPQSAELLVTKSVAELAGKALGRIMERRPRQADDSSTRRVRQPRIIGKTLQFSSTESLGKFMERRPRHADDSAARRVRQPRPSTGV
jgi:hypothetical protein